VAENTTAVVDQKPKELLPVDPDVKIPDAVKRRSAAVDAYFAQQVKPPEEVTQTPVPPTAQPQAAEPITPPVPPVSPAEPPPVAAPSHQQPPSATPDADDPNEGWERRFARMQGRFTAERKLNAELQGQIEQMGDELQKTQALMRRSNGRQQPQNPPPPPSFLTEKDVTDYGSDTVEFAQRAAKHAIAPDLLRLEDENNKLRHQMMSDRRRAMMQIIEAQLPNWKQIDDSPRWKQWLNLRDPYSGRIRGQLLNDAMLSADAPRVVSFFQGFIAEEKATGHLEPPSAPPPVPLAPPKEPAIPLASLAAPGRPRPAGGGDSPPLLDDKPVYSRADIAKQYRLHNSGKWPGTEADWKRWENDLFLAQHEGRIRN